MHTKQLKSNGGCRLTLAAATVAALTMTATLSAPAQAARGYISLGIGLSDVLDQKISSCTRQTANLATISCAPNTDTEPAPVATLAGGLLFGHFSAELAYTNRRAILRDAGGDSSTSPFYGLQMHELFANGYFHFAIGSRLRPYIGFGLGFGDFRIKANGTIDNAGNTVLYDAIYDDSLFGFQGLLGVDVQLSPNSIIGLGLRFTSFSGADVAPSLWTTSSTPLVASFTSSFKDLDFVNVTLDYSYHFDFDYFSKPSDKNKWISAPDAPERDRFGFYLQTAIPYMYAPGKLDVTQQVGNIASTLSFNSLGGALGTGIGLGVHIGALRLEVSYDFRQYTNRDPSFQVGCTNCITSLGDYTVQEYMALAYWDFKPLLLGATPLAPYIGAGFGVADTETSFLALGADAGSANGYGADKDAVATARLSAGLSYPIDERVNLGMEMRFSWYDKANFVGGNFSLAVEEQFHFGTAVVLRYQF